MAAASEANEKLKVAVFQGYCQNKETCQKSLASIRSLYKNKIEFVIIEAPNKLPIFQRDGVDLQTNCWFYYSKDTPLDVTWGKLFDTVTESDVYGLDNSLKYITEYLKQNKFDYYLGFSQGAAFLSLLCQKKIISDAKKLIFRINILWAKLTKLFRKNKASYLQKNYLKIRK
jgi:hypothetical protein